MDEYESSAFFYSWRSMLRSSAFQSSSRFSQNFLYGETLSINHYRFELGWYRRKLVANTIFPRLKGGSCEKKKFLYLSVCLCQVKGTHFFIFQRKSREEFLEAQITNSRSIQLEILLLVKEKVKFNHRGTIFSNDHFSDVISRGELESHLEQLEILMLWQHKVECEFPEGPFFRCSLDCSDGPIEKKSKVKIHQLMHVPDRVSTISIICLILFEMKTIIYRNEKVWKGRRWGYASENDGTWSIKYLRWESVNLWKRVVLLWSSWFM